MPREELIFARDDIEEMLATDNPLVIGSTNWIVIFWLLSTQIRWVRC